MTIIIDAGHGSFYNGKYYTDKKLGKFYSFPEFTFYEGVSNRTIADLLVKKLKSAGINTITTYHEYLDWSLYERVKIANQVQGDSFFVSIHSNAGGGSGFEVYTTTGHTKSDEYAQIISSNLIADFPNWQLRKDVLDGDLDKEKDFYVLKHTKMPSVLLELLFFDEIKQAKYLNSLSGQQNIVNSIFKSIKQIV